MATATVPPPRTPSPTNMGPIGLMTTAPIAHPESAVTNARAKPVLDCGSSRCKSVSPSPNPTAVTTGAVSHSMALTIPEVP